MSRFRVSQTRPFIAYLYEVCFGRGALASELELWKSRILKSGYGRRDLAFWFVETAILEEMRQADAGRQQRAGTVSIMGTDRVLNTETWKTRAEEIRDGRNLVKAAPLSAPYVVRPHTIRVSAIASLYKGGTLHPSIPRQYGSAVARGEF